jgi:Protein of unknown function (DUF1329)
MNMGRSWCVTTALVLSALGASVHADVAPGDKIDGTNVAKAKDLISPGLEWCIKRGFPITVGESKRVEWPRAYKEATEKYAPQVKLSADGLTVSNYVAGQPFPNLDPKDPQFALKIMWNYEYGFANGLDDTDLRNFDADTGTIPTAGPMTVERHFLLDHLRRLFWTARLYVDPKPEKPNPNGYRVQQGLYPILEPFDLKGVGALGNRYIDSAKQDDSWLYLPSLRRVRRLSTAQRSDALFGQDTDVDSYNGYAGQVAWMDWKYLGEKEVLGPVHAEHFPVKWAPKVDWAFDDVWEKRKVYVIEGTSKLPQYAYSKRVLFIDKEYWGIPFSDIYDRSGELWKIWINDLTFRKSVPGNNAIVYEDEMPFAPAIVMVDLQLEHATKASLPSPRFPGEQGWYFHQGEKSGATDDWFTVAALVAAGR